MKEEKWQEFYKSGSVIDYLGYKAYADDDLDGMMQRHQMQKTKKEDYRFDAGIRRSDGNDHREHSDGRI